MSISSKITSGQVVLYRRVSTTKQAKAEYKSQLKTIKSKFPHFNLAKSTISEKTEVVSGLSDPEVRMATALGSCLRILKRNPNAILLVSNADRLARRADIFLLMQTQGFGRRIFDASSGMSLDDIIQEGIHRKIENTTHAQRVSCQAGTRQRQASGGKLGFSGIGAYSNQGNEKKQRLAERRKTEVLSVVSQLVIDGHGRRPTNGEICDELNRHEIRTGQCRFFNPERLSQFAKRYRREWDHALDSYARSRRRIKAIVNSAIRFMTNLRAKRRRQLNLFKLARLDRHQFHRITQAQGPWSRTVAPSICQCRTHSDLRLCRCFLRALRSCRLTSRDCDELEMVSLSR